MIKIAHRGNISGPSDRENHPDHLMEAISNGYDIEFDLWKIGEDLWLGHDGPQYIVADDFLLDTGSYSWIHCKNLDAMHYLNVTFPQLNYFWHQEDDYTLTSQGFIWAYPEKDVTSKTVIVDLGPYRPNQNAYGVCSDWSEQIES